VSSLADDSRWPLLCHSAQMASAHRGVENLVCGRTTEKWFPLLIASSTLFVDARRSSKTPRPEKVTKVARNCTEKYSVDWRPKINVLFLSSTPQSEHTQQRRLRTTCEPFKSATCAPMSGQKCFGSDMRRLCEPAPLGSRVLVLFCRQIAVYGKRRR